MTRIKTLAIGAITTAMIFGSTIVLANESTEQAGSDTVATPASATVLELANPAPVRRGGGGSGKALKK